MAFHIRMGIPEMETLWNTLQTNYRNGTINKKDGELYKKWGNALKKLADNPHYPSLNTHEINPLSKRYGMKLRSLAWSRIQKMQKMGHMTESVYQIFFNI